MNNKSPIQLLSLFRKTGLRRGSMFGIILLVALLAFEVFNYSTTDFALTDLLGKDLTFLGLRWATILAIAFCGIDFAGIARLFTPEQVRDAAGVPTASTMWMRQGDPAEVWYLFGAWILAASMNATLTWWGVAIAIGDHTALGSAILGRETLTKVVPVFVAVMVWIIRLLLIGTFSMAGERLFSLPAASLANRAPASRFNQAPARPLNQNGPPAPSYAARPAVTRPQNTSSVRATRPEPTYHPIGMAAKPYDDEQLPRR